MKRFPLSFLPAVNLVAACTLLMASPFARAQITANFNDGNGTDSVDQFQGIAGEGWATPWATNTNGASTGTILDGFVDNIDPLNGGGNYLSSTLIAGTGVGKGVQQRAVDVSSLDILSPYTVSFDIRLDSSMDTFTSATDYLQAFDRPFDSDFGANGDWLIRATGASVNGIAAHNWMFYNGGQNGGAFNNANFVDSGVELVAGMVYHFVVDVDPLDLQYTVSINGGEASAPMGFRTNVSGVSGNLNFGGQLSDAGEAMIYSIDTVAVIPEPNSVALAGTGWRFCCVFGVGWERESCLCKFA